MANPTVPTYCGSYCSWDLRILSSLATRPFRPGCISRVTFIYIRISLQEEKLQVGCKCILQKKIHLNAAENQ
jgi:hypothetical protein